MAFLCGVLFRLGLICVGLLILIHAGHYLVFTSSAFYIPDSYEHYVNKRINTFFAENVYVTADQTYSLATFFFIIEIFFFYAALTFIYCGVFAFSNYLHQALQVIKLWIILIIVTLVLAIVAIVFPRIVIGIILGGQDKRGDSVIRNVLEPRQNEVYWTIFMGYAKCCYFGSAEDFGYTVVPHICKKYSSKCSVMIAPFFGNLMVKNLLVTCGFFGFPLLTYVLVMLIMQSKPNWCAKTKKKSILKGFNIFSCFKGTRIRDKKDKLPEYEIVRGSSAGGCCAGAS